MAVARSSFRSSRIEPDERQRQAIEHIQGPMLVVAGAGTGKTTVLIQRIARLIREGHARADELLALTYTDNAADEMQKRVAGELRGTNLSGMRVCTFHAYCNLLLQRSGKGFGVLDDIDLWIYLRRRIRELNLNYFVRAANVGQFLHDMLDFMRRCQDELIGPEQYAEYIRRVGCGEFSAPRVTGSKHVHELTPGDILGRCQEVASVFSVVERMLREANFGTFGHMITRAWDLFQSDEQLLAKERSRARFILVDEFQDANFAQVKILQKLAGDDRNVFAVGDPDQAIYRFRGASSAAFGLFQRHFPGAKLVVLDKNRRSTTPILQVAFAAISKNPESFLSPRDAEFTYKRAPLVSAREEEAQANGQGMRSPVVDLAFTDKEVECADVVAVIQEKKKELRCQWRDFAVIYRQHLHREQVAEELAANGIPFFIENMDVTNTPEVRDLLACAGGVVSTNDGASVFRVAALPQFTIAPEDLRSGIQVIPRDAKNAGISTVLAKISGGPAVLDTLMAAREEIAASKAKARAALAIIIRRFALNPRQETIEAVLDFAGRWEQKAITETGTLGELMEYLGQLPGAKGSIALPCTEENAVRLITAHGAKGLEFGHVFVLRVRSGSFPSSYKEPLFEFPQALRDPDSVGQGEDKLLHDQEERRLFYVAMTRARDSLTLYGKQSTGKDPTPPGYLRELVKDRKFGLWLQVRKAREFQTEIFAAGVDTGEISRAAAWLSMPPAIDLAGRLSASGIQSYETCPLRFKMEREWRIPREAPAPLQYGAAMHRVLSAYDASLRAGRPLEETTLVEMFRADLSQAGIQDRYQHDLYETQGVVQLQGFLIACAKSPTPKVLHTEEPFEMKIGKTTVAGRIDRIDDGGNGEVIITDYKTGRPQTQDDADDSLQLSIYAMAANDKWGYRANRLVLYNLQENMPVETARNQQELERARCKVEEVSASIAAGKFNAKTGFHCGFCPYYNLCPATEKRLYSPFPGKAKATVN